MSGIQQKISLQMAASLCAAVILVGCSVLPSSRAIATRYDLGPAPLQQVASTQVSAVALAPMQVPVAAGSSTAVHYRLAYADAQVLYAYSHARWSSPPASIVQQRLKDHLSQSGHVVLSADEGVVAPRVQGRQVPVLRLALEEFTQVFSSEQNSVGAVRVRATLVEPSPQGEVLLAQKIFVAQPQALAPNAEAGVQALAKGVDEVGEQMMQWLKKALSQRE